MRVEDGVTADGVAASGITSGGAVVDGVASGVAARHTRDTAAPGKSAERRVSRVTGDIFSRGDSVLGGRVGPAHGAESSTSRIAQK